VTVITQAFAALAQSEREAFGAPDHPLLIVQHPIGTVDLAEVYRRADSAFEQLVKILLEPRQRKTAAAG
jgi:hypothetical protein